MPVLVEKAAQEEDSIKPLALQLLYNALRQPSGDALREAQKNNAINVCADLLQSKSKLKLIFICLGYAIPRFVLIV